MNVHNHPRGSICVERTVLGEEQYLLIQDDWQEYYGCFSII